jgi:hypothetical protein
VGDGREMQVVFFVSITQKFSLAPTFLVRLAGCEEVAVGGCAGGGVEGVGATGDGTAGCGWRGSSMEVSSCSGLGAPLSATAPTGWSDCIHRRSNEAAGDGDLVAACVMSESDSA